MKRVMYYYFDHEIARIEAGLSKPTYRYVWSSIDRAYIRYTAYIYDPHSQDMMLGKLVASLPLERLPIRKILSSPMIFTSPRVACEWVSSMTGGTPATYNGSPLIANGFPNHVQANGLIVNVSKRTFSWNDNDRYPFSDTDDSLILSVLDTNGDPFYPKEIFEDGQLDLAAVSEQQAIKLLHDIISIRL